MFVFASTWWSKTRVRRRRPMSSPLALQSGCELLESRQVLSAVSVSPAVVGHTAESDVGVRNVFKLPSPIDARAIILQRMGGDGSHETALNLTTVKLPPGMVIHGIILQNGLADPPPDIIQRADRIYMFKQSVLARGLIVSYEVEGQEPTAAPRLEVFRFPAPTNLKGIIPCVIPGDTRQAW